MIGKKAVSYTHLDVYKRQVYYSLTDFNMFQTPKFVGLENYSALFQDEKFYKSLGNTLYMTVLGLSLIHI